MTSSAERADEVPGSVSGGPAGGGAAGASTGVVLGTALDCAGTVGASRISITRLIRANGCPPDWSDALAVYRPGGTAPSAARACRTAGASADTGGRIESGTFTTDVAAP